MQLAGGTRMAAADASPPAGRLQLGIDAPNALIEQTIVGAELQQLRVGVLEDLERRLGVGLGVVDERRVPGRITRSLAR